VEQIEPMHGISTDETPPTIDSIAAAGDFHHAPRRGRLDLDRRASQQRHDHQAQPDADQVVLSDVANVSCRAQQGMSASAIAADLGLSTAEVMTDLQIATAICDPSEVKEQPIPGRELTSEKITR
jgi:hypothetical protein